VFGVLILDVESNNAESTPVSPVDSIFIYELGVFPSSQGEESSK